MSDDVLEAIALRRAHSLTEIVHDELERLIVSGELLPGERLNEQALAQTFGVSRGPVREALRALERAQLVTTRLNQGFFVRENSPEEITEIYEVRAVVYGFICARLADLVTGEELADLDGFVTRMDAAIDAGDAREYYRLNLEFHEHSIVYARHRRAQQTYRSLINESHLTRKRSLNTVEHMQASNAEHRKLLEAVRAGDAGLARKRGEAHGLAGRRRWQATRTGPALAPSGSRPDLPAAAGRPSARSTAKPKKA